MCPGTVMVTSGKQASRGVNTDHVEKCLQCLGKKPTKIHGENQWSRWESWQENQGNTSGHGRANWISKENKFHCKVEKARGKWEASWRLHRNSLKSFLAFKNATLTYPYISKFTPNENVVLTCTAFPHSPSTLKEGSRRSSLANPWFVIRPQ